MDEPEFRMGKLDHVHIRVPNRAEAARLLGIGRPNLYAKMRELGLNLP